tara:strand:- start:2079 stop:2357 length:279 start_codon:yes stop_codon:yes gene_type:complete
MLTKGLLGVLSIIFFITGVVAIFLPFSPSIVFFAISAFCLLKVSPKLENQLRGYPRLYSLISEIRNSRVIPWRKRLNYLAKVLKRVLDEKNA